MTVWWRRRGLNSRPLGCEPNALPAELRPHILLVHNKAIRMKSQEDFGAAPVKTLAHSRGVMYNELVNL